MNIYLCLEEDGIWTVDIFREQKRNYIFIGTVHKDYKALLPHIYRQHKSLHVANNQP